MVSSAVFFVFKVLVLSLVGLRGRRSLRAGFPAFRSFVDDHKKRMMSISVIAMFSSLFLPMPGECVVIFNTTKASVDMLVSDFARSGTDAARGARLGDLTIAGVPESHAAS
jgi:hypothetical protein